MSSRETQPATPSPEAEDSETGQKALDEKAVEGAAAPDKAAKRKPQGFLSFIQELPVLLVIAFVLALLIKTFLMQAFYIPSESMEPTLNVGDRVLVNKVVYHLHPPRRGDIIVFADPNPEPQPHRNPPSAFWHWLTEGLGVATSPEKDFIKRVVGLPGDHVECKAGGVFVNGERLNEPYIKVVDDRPCGPYDVPANKLFVMGDNRLNSRDSRYGLGFIPYSKVIGRAFVIIWPPSHMGWLRGS
jgi:signal peptidase I